MWKCLKEDFTPKQRTSSRKSKKEATPPPMVQADVGGEETPPSVSEVCENFGLNDVDLEYTDADYQNLTTYKLFQQTYRQRIQGANPKVKRLLLSRQLDWYMIKNILCI